MTADRQKMDVDIVCTGFGPASAGFLTTLNKAMAADPTAGHFQSKVMPGMPLQVEAPRKIQPPFEIVFQNPVKSLAVHGHALHVMLEFPLKQFPRTVQP